MVGPCGPRYGQSMTGRADPDVRTPVIGPTVAYVRSSGGDADALIRRFGLAARVERDDHASLPLSELRAFYDEAARAANDPFLGVHVAASVKRGTYGLVEFLCRSAGTLGDALERLVRFIALLNDVVEVRLRRNGGEVVLEQEIPGSPLCVGRHGNEFFVASLVLQARALCGIPVVPVRAWLAHPRPRDVSTLASALGLPRSAIAFGAGKNGLAISPAVLALPILSADETLHSFLHVQAERTAAELAPAPRSFLARVATHVRDNLDGSAPALDETARAMRLSPRTLQRRLADHGTGYQQVLDGVREELARAYVDDERIPIGEMAYRLGYADESAFLRAFRRWTGTSPSRLRAAGAVAQMAPSANDRGAIGQAQAS